jgi:hypothetical protein
MKKIMDVGNTKWCALFSGDASFAQQVVAGLARKAAAEKVNCDFAWMETNAELVYQECYESLIENRALRPFLLTRDTFISRSRELLPLDSQIVSSVNAKLGEFELSCQLMFCGFDSAGPHIFTVVEPGAAQWNDLEGYNAIGIGKEAATSRIAFLEIKSEDTLPSMFYDLFDSKVASEIIQGVGFEWDGRILVNGKPPIEIPEPIKKLVDQMWMVHNRGPYYPEMDEDDIPPRNYKSKMKKFCDECLSTSPAPSPPNPPQS